MKRLIAVLILIVMVTGATIAALGMSRIRMVWSQIITMFHSDGSEKLPLVVLDKSTTAPEPDLNEAKLTQKPTERPVNRMEAASFDVAKLSSDGLSVFAGKAGPNARVRVLVDARPVGQTIADENGEWVLIVDKPVMADNPKLLIETEPEAHPPSRSSAVAEESIGGPSEPQREAALETVPMTGGAPTGPSSSMSVDPVANLPTIQSSAPDLTQSGPVPIKFVFGTAAMTDEGLKAADTLSAYVRSKGHSSIKLTGHADERGPDNFNLALSAQRLKAVADYLRAGGYTGTIDLVPKGEGEPYTALDRTRLPQELLYDLDRRVEVQMVE